MKRLPTIQILHDADEHRRRLAEWLVERSIDLALRDEGSTSPAAAGIAARDAGPALAVHQIRLMYPGSAATQRRLLYFAVLEHLSTDCFLVAPFSPYAVPAFPDELKVDRETLGLSVLTLWNRRAVSEEVVGCSWVVDELKREEREHIAAVIKGDPLPQNIRERVGPPVHHPLDPRWAYRDEEMADLDRAFDQTAERSPDAPLPEGQTHERVYLKAAEKRRLYGRVPRFAVESHSALLQVAFDAGMGPDLVEVVDDAGRRSVGLEGGMVHTSKGRRSAPISGGEVVVDRDFAREGLMFIEIDGVLLNLQPVD